MKRVDFYAVKATILKKYKNKSRVTKKMAFSAQFLAIQHEYNVVGKSSAFTSEHSFHLSPVKSSVLQTNAFTTC